MSQSTPRNAPCPCGSGKKYKQCHLGQELEEANKKKSIFFVLVCVVAFAAGAVGWIAVNFDTGIGLLVGIIVVGGMVVVFRDPPPPNAGGGDPAGMDFGR